MLKQISALSRADRSESGLRAVLGEHVDGEQVIVLTNREPIRHDWGPDRQPVRIRSTGGVVSAMEPLVRECSATWIAHGSGAADLSVSQVRDGLDVVDGDRAYRLRRVWLDEDEENGYYYGAANEGLWPLCHDAHVQPVFRSDDLNTYWTVNERFAQAALEEATSPHPIVLVQDYHLALAPAMIRERLPESTIVTFWHIPWPSWQRLAICPWRHHIVRGLLGSDVLGLQTVNDCRNFVAGVERSIGACLDHARDSILHDGRRIIVRAYPASIDWPRTLADRLPSVDRCRAIVRSRLELDDDVRLGIGVDRLDYTKGLVEKFLAVERLLEVFPEHRDRFVFVQIAAPSRDRLPAYRDVRSRLHDVVNRINERFGTGGRQPARLLESHHGPEEVYHWLRAADVCYVGSLHDGMNLVAKEFVAAREDERGALILSAFTGASEQLTDALLVNPYDVDEAAAILHRALTLPEGEAGARMRALRAHVSEFTAHRWAADMLQDACRLTTTTRAVSSAAG